ncbi:MAG TPA: iron chelate uptake ABC transporter family permease subunit [Agitococcus sp.]|uniref:iron chelate uptake ABC transporter family permease subunit n=1 Tax=uncultured Agitococcus sp. TaxID=1506599 RepID=UPI002610F3C6|nr:iron chelate uptake ABC transporter family permease subunit [uncultured Agitococcus sp.]HNA22650.1 iron chelate uptake ABC transporter family permease subunit [Agitococcus sp.]HNG10410.1 iron chelate uptake ABC transporter family permease subunit [Agitococcus sp.]HNI64061.1 iron chelate uptake ABC transporter family permease subunit [Agitococcus sp.]HNP02041.1 iron chelate uptake ABC transporter family permease subunit [Agitococcus sp.]
MWELLWPAWLAGSLLALVAAPLGCLLVWRRLAYFGDSLSHATLLGVALSLWLHIPVWGGLVAVCVMIALILASLLAKRQLPSDALLMAVSTTTLSAGLIAISKMDEVRVDLLSYLFGDLLSISSTDLPVFVSCLGLVLLGLAYFWRDLLLTTIDEDLAFVEGLPVTKLRLLLLILLALVVTVAMKAVGSLLITALLVIPSLVARPLVNTPTQMVLLAAMTGVTAVSGGLLSSFYWDTPVGASIVVSAALLFVLAQVKVLMTRLKA